MVVEMESTYSFFVCCVFLLFVSSTLVLWNKNPLDYSLNGWLQGGHDMNKNLESFHTKIHITLDTDLPILSLSIKEEDPMIMVIFL